MNGFAQNIETDTVSSGESVEEMVKEIKANPISDAESVKGIIKEMEETESVPLYKELDTASDILAYLEAGTEVVVLETFAHFSLIEVNENVTLETDERFGYVETSFIDFQEDEETEDGAAEDIDELETDEQVSEEAETEDNEMEMVTEEEATIKPLNTSSSGETVYGIALKQPTAIYAEKSTSATKLKQYAQGALLKYTTIVNDSTWYEARVKVKGKWETGYIHKNDVDNKVTNQVTLQGVALKSPTHIYSKAATNSKSLKSYRAGSILKYKTLSNDWYEARVKVKGKWETGYIHKKDVDNRVDQQESLQGVALKSPTHIYSRAATNSKSLKSYKNGTILKYQTFSENWYEAKVRVNGKWETGYIHKNDVDTKVQEQVTLYGNASAKPTKIYSRASTNASVLRTYKYGTMLKYQTFSTNWYEAKVKINGQWQIGYIHKDEISLTDEGAGPALSGYAKKQPTNVYSEPSQGSQVISNYDIISEVKVRTFDRNWYYLSVTVNGKKQRGYIHVDDIAFSKSDISKKTEYNLTLSQALEMQMKVNPQTDTKYGWVSKNYIEKDRVAGAEQLNVRIAPNENNKPLGTLTEGTKVDIVDEYNGWYQIKYAHTTQWVSAGPKDVRYYLNPNNFNKHPQQQFQFLDLSFPSGAATSLLNKYLNGKGVLSGQAKAFVDGARLHGVNDIYLISHAILETGNGSSQLANGVRVGLNSAGEPTLVTKDNEHTLTKKKMVYNVYGIGALDRCPLDCGATRAYTEGWDSVAKAIRGGAQFIGGDYIKAGQNTLYKMRWNPDAMASVGYATHQYATDIGWASKQITNMYNMYQAIGYDSPILDIPVYR